MNIIFRPQRGTLADAMLEKQEFNNETEMKEYIVKQWNNIFDVEDIVIGKAPVNDTRIGWKDTVYVCV